MDKSTHQICCKQWMTIINNCLASGITKKPGAKKTASQKNRFITGSGYSVAKLTLSRNVYGKSCVSYTIVYKQNRRNNSFIRCGKFAAHI